MAEIFTQRLAITPADIDELGHVNNVVYLRWAQEIAIAHWQARAGAQMLGAYVWVVARHEIDYRASLGLGEEAEARTYVDSQAHGATWVRFVDIVRVGEAKPAASIVSRWVLLDLATRRVKRVPPEIVARFA